MLTGDGTVDDGSVSEDIEETRLRSGGNPREPAVPLAEQHPQLVAQLGEVAEARFQFGEPLGHQRADASDTAHRHDHAETGPPPDHEA